MVVANLKMETRMGLKYLKATDVQRDSYWSNGVDVFKVIGSVDGFIVYRFEDDKPFIDHWEFFVGMFSEVPQHLHPKRFCKCGCGEEISPFSSRKRMFLNNTHKGRFYTKGNQKC